MGTSTGNFSNSTTNYQLRITGSTIANGGFLVIGDVTQQIGGQSKDISSILQPIRATQLRFNVREDIGLIDDIASATTTGVKIDLIDADTSEVKFYGYLQQEIIESDAYWNEQSYTLTAYDGLTLLKSIPNNLIGKYTLSGLLAEILNNVDTVSQALYVADWQEVAMTSNNLSHIRFDVEVIDADNYYDLLDAVLDRFGLTIGLDHSRGVLEWRIQQRKVIGVNTTGWIITLSDGTVSSAGTINDSATLSTADIFKEHKKGILKPIEKLQCIHEWQTDDPFITNSQFQQWNEALDNPIGWEINLGSVTRADDRVGVQYVARSTAVSTLLFQRCNYIKTGGVDFSLTFRFSGMPATNTGGVAKTFTYAQVRFIDPNGVQATEYMQNATTGENNPTSTSASFLTYDQEITSAQVTAGNEIVQTITLNLDSSSPAYTSERIVEVDFYANRSDAPAGTNYWSSIDYKYLKKDFENVQFANQYLYEIDSSILGKTLTKTFQLGQATIYNAKGSLEIYDGSAWVVGSDWDGTSGTQRFDEVYIRYINNQTKANTKYYKLSIAPNAFAEQSFFSQYVFTENYTPLYLLTNYNKSKVDVQLVELTDYIAGTLTKQYQAVGEGTVSYDVETVAPVRFPQILETSGTVITSYPKPSAGADPQVQFSWTSVQVFYSDGTTVSVPNDSASFDLEATPSLFEPRVFYYDVANNVIETLFRTVWFASSQYRDQSLYVKLWEISRNTDIGNSALVVPKVEAIAKRLFENDEFREENGSFLVRDSITTRSLLIQTDNNKAEDGNFERYARGWWYIANSSDDPEDEGIQVLSSSVWRWTTDGGGSISPKQGNIFLWKADDSGVVSYAINKTRIPIRYTTYSGSTVIRRGSELTVQGWIKTGASSQGYLGLAFYNTADSLVEIVTTDTIFSNQDWKRIALTVKFNGKSGNNPSGVNSVEGYRDFSETAFLDTSNSWTQSIAYCRVIMQGLGDELYFDDIQVSDLIDSVEIRDGAVSARQINVEDLFAQNITIQSGGELNTAPSGNRLRFTNTALEVLDSFGAVIAKLDGSNALTSLNGLTKYTNENGLEILADYTSSNIRSSRISFSRPSDASLLAQAGGSGGNVFGTVTTDNLTFMFIENTITDGDIIEIITPVGVFRTEATATVTASAPGVTKTITFSSITIDFGQVADGGGKFVSYVVIADPATTIEGEIIATILGGIGSATGVRLTFDVSRINMPNLPTSSTGLSTGDLWNDSGTLKIVT